jgi:hypothetical protein
MIPHHKTKHYGYVLSKRYARFVTIALVPAIPMSIAHPSTNTRRKGAGEKLPDPPIGVEMSHLTHRSAGTDSADISQNFRPPRG